MTDAEKLKLAVEALVSIRDGCKATGRWLDDGGDEAGDGNTREEGPGDGFYDIANPPAGYDAEGWCGMPGEEPAETAATRYLGD